MSQLLVQQYLSEIDRLRKFSGSLTEGVISEAFKDLLKAWARQNNLHFIASTNFYSRRRTGSGWHNGHGDAVFGHSERRVGLLGNRSGPDWILD